MPKFGPQPTLSAADEQLLSRFRPASGSRFRSRGDEFEGCESDMNLGTRRGPTLPLGSLQKWSGVCRRSYNNLFSLGLSGLSVLSYIRVPGPAITRQGYKI